MWLSDEAVDRLKRVSSLPDLSNTRYRLVRPVGSGGMGAVYLVEDPDLGRNVALKVLHAEEMVAGAAERLRREARTIASLDHPNIVPVHDAGVLADGRAFYTMRFVEGRRLDEYRAEGPSLAGALRLFIRVCEAVAYAHSRGFVHRDLKPENVMVGPFGEVLVMDWGTAKVTGTADPAGSVEGAALAGETLDGTVIGTPGYMAPEQAAGDPKRITPRTDVYALGAILFFLATGKVAERRGEGIQFEVGIDRPLGGGRKLRPPFPKAIQAVCRKAMAATPEERYASAEELGDEVARFLDGETVLAYREPPWERVGRFLSANRTLMALVAAYLVVRAILLFLSWR